MCLALGSASLPALDLSAIITYAKENSILLQQYLLTRENSRLEATLDTVKDGVSVSVSSGDLTYSGASTIANSSDAEYYGTGYDYSLTASPQISVVIPDSANDTDSTSLTFSLEDSGYYRLSSGDAFYVMNPALSLERAITFGKTSDERTEILTRYNILLADNTYGSSEIDFETSVYSNLIDILTAEKEIADISRTIEKAQKTLDDAVSLGTLSEDTVSYKEQELSILSSRNSLVSYQAQLDLAKAQFLTLTGLEYDSVENIREPLLDFTPSASGNTAVQLKQSALEIAREDLAIKQAEKTNATLTFNGETSWSVARKESSTDTSRGSVAAGATYGKQSFSIGASAGLSGIGSSFGTSPYVSVSGSWNNNASQESDELLTLQLKNKVLLAQMEYTTALTDYRTEASDLQKDIAGWKMEHARLEQREAYTATALEYQKTLFREAGLANEEDIKDAELQVELTGIDLSISQLNGLILENSILAIQL